MTTTAYRADGAWPLRQHDAIESCKNTDRNRTLLARLVAEGERLHGQDAIDCAVSCADCEARFDDPDHGAFAHCGRKMRHACHVEPR